MSADFEHGRGGYTNHSCRCDLCREAHAAYHRAYMARNSGQKAKHAANNRAWWERQREKRKAEGTA